MRARRIVPGQPAVIDRARVDAMLERFVTTGHVAAPIRPTPAPSCCCGEC